MFLDAISNVFGGIVLIALTVIILLQFSSVEPTELSSAGSQTTSQLTEEIQSLEVLLVQMEPRDSLIHRQYALLLTEVELAEVELTELQRSLERRQAAVREARADLDSAEARMSQLAQQLQEAEEREKTIDPVEPDRRRVGRFRPTDKREIPIMLRAGRMVEVLALPGGGGQPVANTRDLEIDAVANRASPKRGAGLLIGQGDSADRRLVQWLAGRDPSREYLSVAVWPDAFPEAIRMRGHAMDMGFEFSFTPIEEGQGVPFRARSGVQ
ncbi:hypothetical protein [Mucisphaera sp.]|uniref:hypothetical protein n=1 Tax=Mucisphaera sp. TaxID=2913024 RepID=UPI003D110F87